MFYDDIESIRNVVMRHSYIADKNVTKTPKNHTSHDPKLD